MHILALEKRLGVKLIERSKVQSFPTDIGKTYYERLRHITAQKDELENEIAQSSSVPTGLLRVSCPVDFGSCYVAPWLHEFQQAHSALRIELMLNDQKVNLTEEGIDVAIRVGTLPDSSLRARHLGDMGVSIVGSKDYLEKFGMPTTPDDLSDHQFVLYQWLQKPTSLVLKQGKRAQRVQMKSVFSVNNVGAIMQVVKQGGGLHYAPTWFLNHADNAEGLKEVLADWEKPCFPVHALYASPSTQLVPAKVSAFISMLKQKMAELTLS